MVLDRVLIDPAGVLMAVRPLQCTNVGLSIMIRQKTVPAKQKMMDFMKPSMAALSGRTRKAYLFHISQFLNHLQNSNFTEEGFQSYITNIQKNRSSRYASSSTSALRFFFRQILKDGLLDKAINIQREGLAPTGFTSQFPDPTYPIPQAASFH